MNRKFIHGVLLLGLFLSACSGESTQTNPTPVLSDITPAVTFSPANSVTSTVPVAVTTSTPSSSPISTPTPVTQITPIPNTPAPSNTPTPTLPPHPPDPIRGINVDKSDSAHTAPLQDLGFTWIQTFLPPTVNLAPFKVLYRISLGDAVSGKEEDIAQFSRVVEGVAIEYGEFIDAYSVGNEVNLSREWKGQQPNPKLYARLLTIAYARLKQADPTALVVSAGLAPTGGDGPGFADDLSYARAILDAGAGNVMDVYGFHPYGFAYAPEQDPADKNVRNGLTFRRAELHRKLMEEYGLAQKPMWATEFGWIIDPKEEGVNCNWPDFDWQKVSRQTQAKYMNAAFQYAKQNWPWMERMFLWNYDFSVSPLYPDKCEQMKWFSLLDESGQARPSVYELRKVN